MLRVRRKVKTGLGRRIREWWDGLGWTRQRTKSHPFVNRKEAVKRMREIGFNNYKLDDDSGVIISRKGGKSNGGA